MTRSEIMRRLYDEAINQGFQDPFKQYSPDGTQGTYQNWLVDSGYFRVIFSDILFIESLDRYFVENEVEVRLPDETFPDFMRRVIAQVDPLTGILLDGLNKIINPEPEEEAPTE